LGKQGIRGIEMSDTAKNPAQERRRLRAALESMKQKRNLAVGGFVAAMACLWISQRGDIPDTVSWAMRVAAPLIFVPLSMPFLRSPCPQCKQRYHSVASLFRHPDRTLPCKSCGFQIDKHVSMY
jgi:ribosomal protein S27E